MVQERDELKARARDEANAQEARKNKVTVTVDLLGRQVSFANAGVLQKQSGFHTFPSAVP